MIDRSRKQAAVEFLARVAGGDVDAAFDRYVADVLVHHNPYFSSDPAALRAAMLQDAARSPGKVLEVQFALEDGPRVAVFSRIRQAPGDPGFAVVHLFRFEGSRIVELWDVVQAVPEHSANERGMF